MPNTSVFTGRAPAGAVRAPLADCAILAEDMLLQILEGTKTATCAALASITAAGQALPQTGRREVVLDGAGAPACVVETLSVVTCRFDEVPEDFALAEAEGTIDQWRAARACHFARNGGFTPAMKLVCERFRVVEVLGEYKGRYRI